MQNNLPREGVRLSKKQALKKILRLQFFMERNIIYPPHIREPIKYYVAECFRKWGGYGTPQIHNFCFYKNSIKCGGGGGREKATSIWKHFLAKKFCNIVFEGLPWSIMF